MSDKVIDIQKYKGGYYTGKATCMTCHHEWIQVKPAGEDPFFECPKCNLHLGHFIFPIMRKDNKHWTCGCGNDLFYIDEYGAYCPNCGDRFDGLTI